MAVYGKPSGATYGVPPQGSGGGYDGARVEIDRARAPRFPRFSALSCMYKCRVLNGRREIDIVGCVLERNAACDLHCPTQPSCRRSALHVAGCEGGTCQPGCAESTHSSLTCRVRARAPQIPTHLLFNQNSPRDTNCCVWWPHARTTSVTRASIARPRRAVCARRRPPVNECRPPPPPCKASRARASVARAPRSRSCSTQANTHGPTHAGASALQQPSSFLQHLHRGQPGHTNLWTK